MWNKSLDNVKVIVNIYMYLYDTLLNSDRLIGCLWSRDIE
jgi:hypothetical protein